MKKRVQKKRAVRAARMSLCSWKRMLGDHRRWDWITKGWTPFRYRRPEDHINLV